MATANSKLLIDFGFDSRGTSNVNGDLDVTGSLSVQGNLSFSGTSVGNFLPDQDQRSLGNTVNRWNLQAFVANVGSTLTVAGVTTLQEPVTLLKTLSSGNTTITGFANVTTSVNSALLTVGTSFIANTTGSYHTGTINAASFTTSGLLANTTAIVATSNTILLGNSIGRFIISANSVDTISIQSGTINSTSNGFFANAISLSLGNSSVNVAITPAGITSSGGTGVNPVSNSQGTALGTSTQRWVLNANTINTSGLITGGAGATVTGQVNASIGFGSGTVNATSNGLFANATVVTVGNSSVNVAITPAGITSSGGTGVNPSSNSLGTALGTSTQRWILNANTGNFSGELTAVTTSNLAGNVTMGGTLQTISGNSNFDNGTLFVDATNNRVGISNTSPTVAFEVTGAANVSTSVNSALLTVGTSFIANTTGVYHTGLVNATSLSTTGLLANTTALVPTSNTILLGNTTSRFVLSANTGSFSGAVSGITTLGAGNTTVTGFVNATSTIQGGSSLTISGAASGITTLAAGNTTITGFANVSTSVNSALLTVGTSFIANTLGAYHTGIVDAGSFTVATINATSNGFFANATTVTVGNTSVNIAITPAGITSSGGTGVNPSSNTIGTALGTSTQRWILNANTGNFSGALTVSGTSTLTGNTTLSGTLQTISGNSNFDSGVLFVDATNNRVGINNTAPTVALEVSGTVNAGSFAIGTVGAANGLFANATVVTVGNSSVNVAITPAGVTSSGGTGVNPASNTLGTALGTSTQRWILNANTGNFSGPVTIASTLTANGGTGTSGQALLSNGSTGSPYWGTTPGATLQDDTITDDTRYLLFANQTSGILNNSYVSSTNLTFNPLTGTLTSTIFSASSDERLKNNIETVDNPINTINQLRGVSFHRTGSNIKDYGVIAQELEQVLPSLVHHDSQGYKSVSYSSIIGILIEAIKEQQKQINHLLDQ
jgi:hypothetical protein